MQTKVDLIGNGQSQGDVANYIANQGRLNLGLMRPFVGNDGRTYMTVYKGGDPSKRENYVSQLLTNATATLRRDEWKQLDEALVIASRYRLGGIADLEANGLTFNLGNAMGTTVLEWHDVSDGLEADLTMDGVSRSRGDRPVYQHNYMPIPIIHVDYEINARVLAASRNLGNPLDTTSAEMAARRVAEKLENMLFTNTTYAFGATDSRGLNTIYSYINHPDRNTVTMNVHWDASAKTPEKIVTEVAEMKQTAINHHHYGPYMLYIPTAYETVLDEDYNAVMPGITTRERILKIANIKGIKVIDSLPANNVLLVQMTPDVVRLVRGMGLTNVEWETEGKFITKYKVLTIQVPQIRSDQNKKSGIVHLA